MPLKRSCSRSRRSKTESRLWKPSTLTGSHFQPPLTRGIHPRGRKLTVDPSIAIQTRMSRTHLLATEEEDNLGCDASALNGGSPDHLDGGTGSLGKGTSGGNGSIEDINSVT
ncbi:hypothetical protein GUJ93_ZPchr0004g40215 [Zizania palustris]|uniref:Uncharacterized protein n=1 Tax=Zizania palustris TaxID=103762 RepID=A0A8J5SJA1_ZIZPA|nr:hypothetical protein GUJ93_ZPchr0004g40215 [Zizania palustris]